MNAEKPASTLTQRGTAGLQSQGNARRATADSVGNATPAIPSNNPQILDSFNLILSSESGFLVHPKNITPTGHIIQLRITPQSSKPDSIYPTSSGNQFLRNFGTTKKVWDDYVGLTHSACSRSLETYRSPLENRGCEGSRA
jgi:hypothetical protein